MKLCDLKRLRKQNHFSQKEMGLLVGVKARTISAYEKNERTPSPKVAARIAEVFKLDIKDVWQMFYGNTKEA